MRTAQLLGLLFTCADCVRVSRKVLPSELVERVEPSQPVDMIPELLAEAEETSANWGLARMGATDRSGAQGSGTHIYILSTGVRTTHKDFGSRASAAADLSSGELVECNGDRSCALDVQGGGTNAAGAAAGATVGVASKARVYAVKIVDSDGKPDRKLMLGGIDFVVASGRRPAIAAITQADRCFAGICRGSSAREVTRAVDEAVQKGVIIVVESGDKDQNSCGFSPAFVPSAITVGATGKGDFMHWLANQGRCTNIWAPGDGIRSAGYNDDEGYTTFSASFVANAHVAGAVAILLEQDAALTPEQVRQKLLNMAATNYIKNLNKDDTNKLLYIGADAPPPPGNES